MNRILAITIATLLFAASGTATTAPQQTDPVRTIRQQYNAINKRANRYKKIKKELSGFSLEGGELVAYLDGAAIVKIVATHFGEGGNTVEEYYYHRGRLIFVFEKVSHYERPLSGKVVGTAENRFYFSNDKLIRWIDENTRAVTGVDELRMKESEYLANSNQFRQAARRKNRTVEAIN